MGTASCASANNGCEARRCAAASTTAPYNRNTSTALMPTARKATVLLRAAKIFCPYHGAAMYVKQVITISVETNRIGSAALFHCALGFSAS